MKKLLASIFTIVICGSLLAQKIEVKESIELIGEGSNNALSVFIYETSKDQVLKDWKNEMKNYNAKVKTSKNNVFADNALINSIGNNTIDVHAVANESEKIVQLIIAFDLGGAFLNSSDHKIEYKAAEEIVKEFAKKATREGLQSLVDVEARKNEKLIDQKEDLVKENKNLHRDIEKAEDVIKKSKEEIEKNEKEQSKKDKEIESQATELNKAKKRLADF